MDCEVNLNNSENSCRISQTHTLTTFEQFLHTLKDYETATSNKFIFVSKRFVDVKVAVSKANFRIHFQEDVPYVHLGSTIYACHQGKDYNIYNKKKYAENRESKAKTDHVFIKCHKIMQRTKKMNCPAKIIVTRVRKFMNHKVTGKLNNHNKAACSRRIKEAIANGTDLGEECYIFNLPTEEEHKNHFKVHIEPVSKQIREFISNLVAKGEQDAHVIAELTYDFAENDLNESDRTKRKFYPDMKTIRNIISSTKYKLKSSLKDKENCTKIKGKLQEGKSNNIECLFQNPIFYIDIDLTKSKNEAQSSDTFTADKEEVQTCTEVEGQAYTEVEEEQAYTKIEEVQTYTEIEEGQAYTEIEEGQAYTEVEEEQTYTEIEEVQTYTEIEEGQAYTEVDGQAYTKIEEVQIHTEVEDVQTYTEVEEIHACTDVEEVVCNFSEIPQQGTSKTNLINRMNSTIRSIQSVMWILSEEELEQGQEVLNNLLKAMISKVPNDHDNALPIELMDKISTTYEGS